MDDNLEEVDIVLENENNTENKNEEVYVRDLAKNVLYINPASEAAGQEFSEVPQ